MRVLGIETSCDETAVGIVDGRGVRANVVSSQVVHSRYGGVVPELAARNHVRGIVPLTKMALEIAGLELSAIDLFCATYGPGLIGALLVGLSYAKSLAIALGRPFLGVNHLEGHVYALRLARPAPRYPFLVLIVSGGHTEIVLVTREFHYRTLGRTLDDACGEAFDKVAKMLGFPYPGGPHVERAASEGDPRKVRLPVPRPSGLNFSYSGLKTAVLYHLREQPRSDARHVAAAFQEAALDHLVAVAQRAVDATGVKCLGVVGGVSANRRLREKFEQLGRERKLRVSIPGFNYCTDNGAVIALAGRRRLLAGATSSIDLDAVAREPLDAVSFGSSVAMS